MSSVRCCLVTIICFLESSWPPVLIASTRVHILFISCTSCFCLLPTLITVLSFMFQPILLHFPERAFPKHKYDHVTLLLKQQQILDSTFPFPALILKFSFNSPLFLSFPQIVRNSEPELAYCKSEIPLKLHVLSEKFTLILCSSKVGFNIKTMT